VTFLLTVERSSDARPGSSGPVLIASISARPSSTASEGDWRATIYWTAAAVLTVVVTF